MSGTIILPPTEQQRRAALSRSGARAAGCSEGEWLARTAAGQRWCGNCRAFAHREHFERTDLATGEVYLERLCDKRSRAKGRVEG